MHFLLIIIERLTGERKPPQNYALTKEKWLRKYLELPFGIPTDDTYRIVMSNINTEYFYQVTVQLLLHTIEEIALAILGIVKESYKISLSCLSAFSGCIFRSCVT